MRARALLYVPALVLALLAAGVCGLWLGERREALRALGGAPALAAAHGVKLSLGRVNVGGFPLRLRVQAGPVRADGVAGWSAGAPQLVAQAYAWAPRRWVLVALSGVTVERPQGGAFTLAGDAVRASLSGLATPGWLFVAQADGARLTPAPGARTVLLVSARRLELDAKASSQPGETAVLLQVDGGVAAPESALWHVASGAPFDLAASGRLAPNALKLERLAAQAGSVSLSSAGGVLGVGADGRLEGAVPITLRQAPQRPAARPGTPAAVAIAHAQAAGQDATLDLVFADGKARLGPFALGPSPRIAP